MNDMSTADIKGENPFFMAQGPVFVRSRSIAALQFNDFGFNGVDFSRFNNVMATVHHNGCPQCSPQLPMCASGKIP